MCGSGSSFWAGGQTERLTWTLCVVARQCDCCENGAKVLFIWIVVYYYNIGVNASMGCLFETLFSMCRIKLPTRRLAVCYCVGYTHTHTHERRRKETSNNMALHLDVHTAYLRCVGSSTTQPGSRTDNTIRRTLERWAVAQYESVRARVWRKHIHFTFNEVNFH